MPMWLQVLLLAAVPPAGNFLGAILAESLGDRERLRSLMLHAAVGVVLGVVGIEILPRVLDAERAWIPLLVFCVGGVSAVLLDEAFERWLGGDEGSAWSIWLTGAVDLMSDGILIGTGATIDLRLGLLLAIAQVPADVPEGYATLASFRRAGATRGKRLLYSASLWLPAVGAAAAGWFLLRGRPEVMKLSLLAWTGGLLMTLAVERLLTEAHDREGHTASASLVLVGGFGLFAALSLGLGSGV